MQKRSVGFYIVIGVIALVAILPKIIACFQPDASFIEQLLKVAIYLISIALIWFALLIVILLLNMVGLLVHTWLGGEAEDFDKGVDSRTVIMSGIIVIIGQFIDAWGINAGSIEWALQQLFPFLK